MSGIMSSVFGGSKVATRVAAEAAQRSQEQIAKQEAALRAERSEMAKRAQANLRARRGGGMSSLLSSARSDSELGIEDNSKLGGNSSYMA